MISASDCTSTSSTTSLYPSTAAVGIRGEMIWNTTARTVGDAMITGLTRPFAQTAKEVATVLDPKEGEVPFGIHLMIGKNYTVFLADTTINERPTAEEGARYRELKVRHDDLHREHKHMVARLRALGGGSLFQVGGEFGAEKQNDRLGLTLRGTMRVNF